MNFAPMMIAKGSSRDMKVEIIGVLEGAVSVIMSLVMNMVVFGMKAVQTNWYGGFHRLLEFTGTRYRRDNMIVANSIIRAHPKHLKDILRVDLCLLRERLMCEHALQVLLEVITLKMTGNVLITVTGVCLVGMEEVLMIARVNSTRQGLIQWLALVDEARGHRSS